jgi:hypothetical protein
MTRTLDAIVSLYEEEGTAADPLLFEWVEAQSARPVAERDEALRDLAARVDHADPRVGAKLAIAGGALVEYGADPTALARAIVAPLERSLINAKRFVDLAKAEPDLESEDDESASAGPEAGEDEAYLEVDGRALSQETVDRLARKAFDSLIAFMSLETWYRPAAATWSRDTTVLKQQQDSDRFMRALSALGSASIGTHWLSILLGSAMDTRLIVFVPEVEEAWSLHVDGISDAGQLTVLLSHALADTLKKVGASGPADPDVLEVMRGEGPQQSEHGSYASSFHLYPWRAIDPETLLPGDGRFMWIAPGGSGTHSLPPDFQPRAIEPLYGHRVMALVGPKAPGLRFVRVIGASRTFSGLKAKLVATQLTKSERQTWVVALRGALLP